MRGQTSSSRTAPGRRRWDALDKGLDDGEVTDTVAQAVKTYAAPA